MPTVSKQHHPPQPLALALGLVLTLTLALAIALVLALLARVVGSTLSIAQAVSSQTPPLPSCANYL